MTFILLQATAFGLLLAALAYLLFRIQILDVRLDLLEALTRDHRTGWRYHNVRGDEDSADWSEHPGQHITVIEKARKH